MLQLCNTKNSFIAEVQYDSTLSFCAIALHQSVLRRSAGMVKRVSSTKPIVFAGGVARDACMVRLVEKVLQSRVLVPENLQTVRAMGTALLACEVEPH
jgi:(R)-2-hydroxyacyl-CoA dehydratese activating ATPase